MAKTSLQQLLLALLLGSTSSLGNSVSIAISVGLLLSAGTSLRSFALPSTFRFGVPLLIFIAGVLASGVSLLVNAASYSDTMENLMFYTVRKNVIEFAIAVCAYGVARRLTYRKLIDVLLIAFTVNCVVGLYQFAINPFDRTPMLFVEPSSAGYFFASFIAIVVNANFGKVRRAIGVAAFIGSVLIFSKVQMVIYGMMLYLKAGRWKYFALPMAGLLIYHYAGQVDDYLYAHFDQYRGASILVSALARDSFVGFFNSRDVYATYLTRISSLAAAVVVLVQNPLGVGFGGFNAVFASIVQPMSGFADITGSELADVVDGLKYASTKSRLLDLFIASGWVGVAAFAFYVFRFVKAHGRSEPALVLSFAMFVLASVFLELNNIFLYLLYYSALSEAAVRANAAAPSIVTLKEWEPRNARFS